MPRGSLDRRSGSKNPKEAAVFCRLAGLSARSCSLHQAVVLTSACGRLPSRRAASLAASGAQQQGAAPGSSRQAISGACSILASPPSQQPARRALRPPPSGLKKPQGVAKPPRGLASNLLQGRAPGSSSAQKDTRPPAVEVPQSRVDWEGSSLIGSETRCRVILVIDLQVDACQVPPTIW